ncbi:immune inhibitor A [bacterium]|nr:immune inhibitor A [bacterium]
MGRALALLCTSLFLMASTALSVEIPQDRNDLPMWEEAVFEGFPVRILLDSPGELRALLELVPIASFQRDQFTPQQKDPFTVQWVFEPRITQAEAQALEEAGVSFERISDLEQRVRREIELKWSEQAALGGEDFTRGERGVYHTHSQMGQILADAEADHPAIAVRGNIGSSVQGRELWTLKISDNVGVEESEPEIRISANMHGNEKIAMEMSIYLIEYLTNNYGQPGYEDVTNIVDNYEVHFLPLHNPDGHVANDRENANGVDLNRNFPVPDGSIGDDNTWTEEVETIHYKNWCFGQNFVIAQDGHSGAVVVNYPWDYTYELCPDNDAFILLSEEYSYYNSPMWNGSFYHGITNGAQWYVTEGSIQDWAYHETGSMHVILEFSDSYAPSASQLDGYWDDNRESFMHWMKAARYGVNGIVTASDTGNPLYATVTVVGNDKPVYTDPDFGDYYKLLDTGSYDISYSASGYITHTEYGVSTTWGTPTVRNVQLAPEATGSVMGHVHEVGGVIPLDATIEVRSYPADIYVTSAYSDAGNDGFYEIDLIYGDYTFYVSAPDHLPVNRQITVDSPGQTQEFLLPFSETIALVQDDFESGTGLWTGDWALSSDEYHSPSHSMTDSPTGDSGHNQEKPCELSNSINLTEVIDPLLTFWARWEIEEDWDCVQLQISTNGGGIWTPMSTAHTVPGSGQGAQPDGEPVYENFQTLWILETVDLSAWADESNVLLRFIYMSDTSIDEDGFYFDDFKVEGQVVATGAPEESPAFTRLDGAWPNPFNPVTKIRFSTASAGLVHLNIFDIQGRRVATLADMVLPAGEHERIWNGRNSQGRELASGVYLAQLEFDGQRFQKKLTLIK